MPEFSNFIIVTLLLIIAGLFLKTWILGWWLGLTMLNSWAYGIVVAGVVFFKDALVEEIKLVRNSATNMNLKDKGDVE